MRLKYVAFSSEKELSLPICTQTRVKRLSIAADRNTVMTVKIR